MHNWLYWNSNFVEREQALLSISNRSFQYGDGLFESMRIINGQLLFFEDHWERILRGMSICGMSSADFNSLEIRNIADEIIQRNNVNGGRMKLLVYRYSEGFYKPETDGVKYLISTHDTEHERFVWNTQGWQTGLFTSIRKPINFLSEVKSTSALLYVLAAREARINHWDEIFILNEAGFLCEGSFSSVFLVDENRTIHTPALTEGPLPGVMRKHAIKLIREAGMECIERTVAVEELLHAREVFVTNAIQGIRWVVSYRDKRYFNTIGKKVFQLLQNEVENLGLV